MNADFATTAPHNGAADNQERAMAQESQATLRAFEQKKDMTEFRQMVGQAKGLQHALKAASR